MRRLALGVGVLVAIGAASASAGPARASEVIDRSARPSIWPRTPGARRCSRTAARHGFGATRTGAPADGYGRLVYLDTYNSRYGKGWKRENSFLTHKPTGLWCYGFYKFDPTKGYPHPPGFPSDLRGPGTGEKYRLSAKGPGVKPLISILVPGTHDFDPKSPADVDYERRQDALLFSMLGPDTACRHH